MAEDDVTEEAQKVIDALKQLEQIEDPVRRAVAISEVLKDYEERAPQLRDLRRETVLQLRGEKVSYRKIAAMLKVSLGTVQNIERGHGSGWGTKSRTKKPAEE
jgi:DNA-directed RNA polymerase specialized sigma24 family protein